MLGLLSTGAVQSMTARSKWLSWAPPNFITNLETDYAPDETYSLTSYSQQLHYMPGLQGWVPGEVLLRYGPKLREAVTDEMNDSN